MIFCEDMMEKLTEKCKNTALSLLSELKDCGLTFATAESCTGGLIGETITALSGSSEIYEGGIISYSNSVKMRVLSVSEETLSAEGAVSEETAGEMAKGARSITGADIAVSVTGIAGPTGGTAEKPVGTVCFGISTKNDTKTYRKQFGEEKTRDEIRLMAADFALSLVLESGKELSQCLKK